MVNLHRALAGILRNYGHDVLLQRRKPDGKGYEDKLERHTVRHTYPSVRGVPQIMQERPEGTTHVVDMVYYFKAEAEPREGDRIYETDDRYQGMHTGPQYIYTVDWAVPMRGKAGRMVFWTVGATREHPS